MNRMNAVLSGLRSVAPLLGLAALAVMTPACYGDVEGGPGYYPSDAYIATGQPVYYEGHASYWYNGHWAYRDGGRWNYYRSEPAYLAQRRGGIAPPARRVYERPAAAPRRR